MRMIVGVAVSVATLFTAACGGSTGPGGLPKGLASCGSTALLTVSPMAIESIRELSPLGNLNPPGHTLPTDHVYFYPPAGAGGTALVPVVAPGDITVFEVVRQVRSGGSRPSLTDYAMSFAPCADVSMYFGHVSSLQPEIESQVGAFGGCSTYGTSGFTFERCVKSVNIRLTAGAPIGTAGGPEEGALDLGGYDQRMAPLAFANPSRSYGNGSPFGQNHTICPIDYFSTAVRDLLRAKFSGRGTRRTVEPLCGQVMQDVANTAQGRWYFNNTEQEDAHLALVHDNVVPGLGAFSVGTSIASLPSNVYFFIPATTGRVNLDFSRVTADGQIYCYQPNSVQGRHILVQLTGATTLRIEGVAVSACGDPSSWAFTAGAVQFSR